MLIFSRDQMMSCPNGIEIESEPMVNNSLLIEKECNPTDEVFMRISIKNTSRDRYTLVLRRYLFLWDTGVFRLIQKNKLQVPHSARYIYRCPHMLDIKNKSLTMVCLHIFSDAVFLPNDLFDLFNLFHLTFLIHLTLLIYCFLCLSYS